MKTSIIVICLLCVSQMIAAQSPELMKKQASIVEEAYSLYYPEKAAWIATDLLVSKYISKVGDPKNIAGYIAYAKGAKVHCFFYDRTAANNLLIEFIFTKDFEQDKIDVLEGSRKPNKTEKDLIDLRHKTLAIVSQDTFFKQYERTNFNIVPIVEKGSKKVYIMTGSQIDGVIIFGNDYLLTFDKKNKLQEKKAIHLGIHPVEYGGEAAEAESSHIHYADEDPHATATDLCLLLLYQDLTNWKQHSVISKDYLSMWNCQKKSLLIVPTKNMKQYFSKDKTEPDLDSKTAKEHQKWLVDNKVTINKLPKADPDKIVYTCDSVLLMMESKGDTTIRWTIAGTMSLGFSTFGKATIERMILKNENFGAFAYVTGLDFQGHIEYKSLAPKTFLVKNDTLFELETFHTISKDSISSLYKLLFNAKKERDEEKYEKIIAENTYKAFKIIYHPNIFVDYIYDGNLHGDEIEITKIWDTGNGRVVNIEIRNKEGNTRYNYRFDEKYNFVDYDGCMKETLDLLTEDNRTR